MITAPTGLCSCKCLIGKYKLGPLIITVKLLPFKNPGCTGELPLIAVKSFHRLKNKRKLSGKTCYFVREMSWKCQGILNGLKCGNPEDIFVQNLVSPFIWVSLSCLLTNKRARLNSKLEIHNFTVVGQGS